MKNRKFYLLILGVFLGLILPLSLMAREINVRGRVTNLKGELLYRVSIYRAETNKLVGVTNADGKYLVKVDSEDSLIFSSVGYEERIVPVDGQLTINVVLDPTSIALDEVTVAAKRVADVVAPEPTDIEMIGNYFHIKTRVKVPKGLFSTDARLIIQPGIFNVSKGTMAYLAPLVFDGKEYHITQERMHDYDLSRDPLSPYVEVKQSSSRDDDMISYRDSIYVENPNQDFRCDMMVAMEDYRRVVYRDTFIIARGVVNPLRFLEYNVSGKMVENASFFPKPEMQLRDTRGDVNFTFRVGGSRLYVEDGNNREELNRLIAQIRQVENDPNSQIKSFSILGTASPDGGYKRNKQLAEMRVEAAVSLVMKSLGESGKYIDKFTAADVEPWSRVIELLRNDGKNKEADAIQAIVNKWPDNPNRQSQEVLYLPFYRSVIAKHYLPRLRRVSYELLFSQYRYLTDDEIKELYRENSSELSRNEFWRLYHLDEMSADREAICRRALAVYPDFMVAATDLAAILIDKGQPDVDLLKPYLNQDELPDETRLNQAVACLSAGLYSQADSLAVLLPDTGMYHQVRIYAAALNGRYSEVVQEISAESPFNEVLMLLAIKADKQAWEKAQKLGDSAKEDYIRAVAANRVDEVNLALSYMERAFEKDPSLRDVASVDGDLVDLLQQ